MIQNVEIEGYFQKNIGKIKKNEFLSVVAWKSGSLVNYNGKTETFEKDKSETIRRGEYDYVVRSCRCSYDPIKKGKGRQKALGQIEEKKISTHCTEKNN